MFQINDDLSIYATRGDTVFFTVSADTDGVDYIFKPDEVLRMKIFGKKNAENVVMQKDFVVIADTDKVDILLTEDDTKFGDIISKPTDYWYEIELNPFTNPQTIIGYDEDGAKVFKLFPEGKDLAPDIDKEEIPVVDEELSLTSDRPVSNKAITRGFINIQAHIDETIDKKVDEKVNDSTEKVINDMLYAGFKGEQGTQGPKGDPGLTEAKSLNSITSSGVYRVNDTLYLASIKPWDTDLCVPFRYTGDGAISPDLNYNRNTSSITGGDILDGPLLLKYENIYKGVDGVTHTGATYICLGLDGETFKVYIQDSPDTAPYDSHRDYGFIGDEIVDLSSLITEWGTVGLGEDICGNWELIKQYFVEAELDISKIVSEADIDKNTLKGNEVGS